MAAIETTNTLTVTRSFGGVSKLSHSLFGTFANWADARATRVALSKLNDRELSDIGLIRGDIDSVARRHG